MVALTLDTTATIYVVFERFTDDAKSAELAARLGAGVEDVPVRLARALDILRQRLWEVARAAERGGGASMGE